MTSIGACISFVIRILILIFGLIKLEHLLSRKNPTLSKNEEALEVGEIYETAKEEFMLAFTVEHWATGVRDDPRYIQWTVVLAN